MGIFKPAWQNNDVNKAVKAVRRINNQRQLMKIAEYDFALPDSVKDAALANMTQETLETLAFNGKNSFIRPKVLGMVKSYNTLIEILRSELPNYRPFNSQDQQAALFALKSILHNSEVDTNKKVDAVRICEELIYGDSRFGVDLIEYKAVPSDLRALLGFEVMHSKDRIDGAEATWHEDRYTVFYSGKEIGSYIRSTY